MVEIISLTNAGSTPMGRYSADAAHRVLTRIASKGTKGVFLLQSPDVNGFYSATEGASALSRMVKA